MLTRYTRIAFLWVLLVLWGQSQAQPGTLDATFNAGDPGNGLGAAANNTINAVLVQSDGKYIVAGTFTSYNGTTINRIARLNTDGTLDNSFSVGTGFNNTVLTLALQSDGKILAGGTFTTYNGTTANRVTRLNSDGTLDATFNTNLGTGAAAQVNAIAVDGSGNVLIGGSFTTFDGATVGRIERRTSTGADDATFAPSAGANNTINALAIDASNRIVIGGTFTTYNGTGRNRIARISTDGSLDATFAVGTGANAGVTAVAITSGGSVLIGGTFTTVAGTGRVRLAQLTSTGSLDGAYTVGAGFPAGTTINNFALQTDGKLIVAGSFATYDGNSRVNLVRINTNGSVDAGFTLSGTAFNAQTQDVVVTSGGQVVAVGNFTGFNTRYAARIVRLSSAGAIDLTFNVLAGATGTVSAVAVNSSNQTYIAGTFTGYSGFLATNLVRATSTGAFDATFSAGTGPNNTVNAMVIQPDGKLIIAGNFTSYNGTTINRVARINTDGSLDGTFSVGTGADAVVNALALQADGRIIVAGNFTTFNGSTVGRIVRLNTNGSVDGTFAPSSGAGAAINALALQADGRVLVGGAFTTFNGATANRIVRLTTTGATDATFVTGTGFNNTVSALSVTASGSVFAGGNFTSYNGATRTRVAKIGSTGTIDATFTTSGGANASVTDIQAEGDERVLIFGTFTTYNGTSRNRIARLNTNGTLNTTFNPGTGLSTSINDYARTPNGAIIIGGVFTTYNGLGANRIARISACDVSTPVITASGSTTICSGTFVTLTAPLASSYAWSTGATTQSINVSTTSSVTVTVNVNGCVSAVSTPVNVTVINCNPIWNGSISNDWNTAGNWTPSGVPATTDSAIIANVPTQPVITGAVSVRSVNIQNGATLTINSTGSLSLTRNLRRTGTLVANGPVNMNGTISSFIQGNNGIISRLNINNTGGVRLQCPITVDSILTIGAGATLNLNGFVMTLPATPSRQARIGICGSGATLVNGSTMRIERYLPPSLALGTGAWVYQGTPSNQNASTYGQSGNTYFSGTFDLGQTANSSLYLFNPSDVSVPANAGFVKAPDPTYVLQPGQGARVWFRKQQFLDGNPKLTFNGTPIVGPYTLPGVSFCNSGNCAGGTATNGFSLVANPYHSPINWDAAGWTKTNIGNQIWIYRHNPGLFASYVTGVGGTNGGSNLIASGQGFFVEATATGPQLQVTEAIKSVTSNPSVRRIGSIARLRMSLRAQSATTADEVLLHWNSASVQGRDEFDAANLASANTDFWIEPQAGLRQSIAGLSNLNNADTVVLGFSVAAQGTYVLNFGDLSEVTGTLTLVDQTAGVSQVLTGSTDYTFAVSAAGSNNTRLTLIRQAATTALSASVARLNLVVAPNPARERVVLQLGTENRQVAVRVLDALGREVRNQALTLEQGLGELSLQGLASGVYRVSATEGKYTWNQSLVIE